MSTNTMPIAHAQLSMVFQHIETNKDQFASRLCDYLRHPSISAHNIGMVQVAALLVSMLSRLGFEAWTIATSGQPMIIGRWERAPGAPTVLLYGHYDVQPPDPLEAWVSPPFEPTIRDGRIYARGAGDNKGQHFAQILALESYLAVHGRLPCNVLILLEGEEEIGSPNIAEFVRTHRDLLRADLVVTADGPLHESDRPIITYGVRGIAAFELRARAANRDVHSGNFGGVVPNPIWTLVHLLATMKNADGEITIDGFYDDVVPPKDVERAAAARLPLDSEDLKRTLGLARLDNPADRPFADRLMFHPTLTVNGFHGGYGGPGSKTVLPHEAMVKCDARLVERQDPDDILTKIEAHVRRHAPEVAFLRVESMPPSKTPLDAPFSRVVQSAVYTAHGIEPLIYPSLGATLPDYVFTKILSIPSFVVPYANADEANHAPNENIKIDCFLKGIRTGAALLDLLGSFVCSN
ncbi:acetylornithine deacetylase/succinyl-diaminopimelate desuccinylase-like protein [Bradyrhizobium sp. USDA 4532]|uniref:M20/M25/M40 family metallo-hydrolase n=1 Tax=unclassified Bradyrhizobium TaxID=2631580 RepID=UPI00209E7B41|nr:MULTISPECIES: M20/M25/M40 family metallo-hydrolase [unclassified Bradyrhizobium]MCP1835582.1 acetylornithine deacetylase/succinyl-diaminopimelate desuccinylase-like protein [Bradyrhizobium sp. USDA 4545]MCP1920331.1 acetylornithine deacetylase/succinyl-diaminopimelate desuccinylase-like protein [Bradyrhizobium sp. USDA 4532]